MICKWCENKIDGYYLKYKGMVFCEDNNFSCIKNYLFEEYDKDMQEDRIVDDDYRMDEVLRMEEMEERGLM